MRIGYFLEMSVGELKFYLQQRSQPISGTHGLLATKALIAHEQNTEVIITAQNLALRLKKDYEQILMSNDLIFDPFTSDKWEDDVTKSPATDIGKIFAYILVSKTFYTEYIGQYKISIFLFYEWVCR